MGDSNGYYREEKELHAFIRREEDFQQAKKYRVRGILPTHPCIKKILPKWVYGVIHGVVASDPEKVGEQLFGLVSSVLSKNKKVLLIDSLNVFNPEVLMRYFRLFSFDKEIYSWFPENLFYSRPFQYLQFYSLITEYIAEFLKKHGKSVELIIVIELLRMFLDPTDHYFDNEYPRKQLSMLVSGLRRLKQLTYQYGVSSIVLMDKRFTQLRVKKQRKGSERKKIPLESIFPIMIDWDYRKGSNQVTLLKHFEFGRRTCRDFSRDVPPQKTLDDFFT